MSAAVVEAVATLRAEGNDVETTASLLLNGAAALLLERKTEQEFADWARQMWRTAARQVELLSLLDRVVERRQLGVRPKRERQCPVQRTLPEGETS